VGCQSHHNGFVWGEGEFPLPHFFFLSVLKNENICLIQNFLNC